MNNPISSKSILYQVVQEYLQLRNNQNIETRSVLGFYKELEALPEVKEMEQPILTEQIYIAWRNRYASYQSERTIYSKILKFRQFSQYLCHIGFPSYVPVQPKRPQSTYIPRIYSHEEILQFFDVIDSTVQKIRHTTSCLICMPVIFRFLYYCGARVGETISIKNEDVDIEKGIVVLKKTKNRQYRIIPLNDSMRSIFSTYVHYRNRLPINNIARPDGCFFTNHRGECMTANTVYCNFRNILEKCGISHIGNGQGPRVHDLRHTFVVHTVHRLVKSGLDIYTAWPILSTLLGHQDIYATEHYIRLTLSVYPDLYEEVANSLSTIFPELKSH